MECPGHSELQVSLKGPIEDYPEQFTIIYKAVPNSWQGPSKTPSFGPSLLTEAARCQETMLDSAGQPVATDTLSHVQLG